MGKPSVYSKTRSQLRRDLAQAGINAKPKSEVEALEESIATGEPNAKSLNDDNGGEAE